jgi:hypothetical protein
MQTKSFVKLLRKVIREEVRSAVRSELQQLNENALPATPKMQRKQKRFVKNDMLNDILNETTAMPADQEWSTMNFKSEMAQAFGMQSAGPSVPLATTDINGAPVNMNNEAVAATVDAMTRDYSGLMKAIDKKRGK